MRGSKDGEYAIPAVGSASINLSFSDCACADGVTTLRTTGFFVVATFGLALAEATGLGVAVRRMIGARFFTGAGATAFFCTGPLPLRPSMTIFPSWV